MCLKERVVMWMIRRMDIAEEASIHLGSVLCPRCNAVAFDVNDEIPKWTNQGYCWCCGQKMKWKTPDE